MGGVEEVLGAIEAQGSRWGIVTNKPAYLAEGVVATMGWRSRCAILLGGDSLPRKKPEPDQLLHACAALQLAPARCVYVGDDERDIVAARNREAGADREAPGALVKVLLVSQFALGMLAMTVTLPQQRVERHTMQPRQGIRCVGS